MSDDMYPSEEMTLFSLLPNAIADEDLAAWATGGSASLAVGTDWAGDDEQLERAAFMSKSLICGLSLRLPAFDLRFLFLAHPSQGASLWHVA